ncbi:heparin lyase I family protein [Flavivirga amylovorans]|uniref:Heparin lyase I family protein n=1 Tax=Flavivirga amylovorans TaxID=870486 RepID=A0ABT8X130_9FLAO|nr:heparin lyase I family protein [Flavivirga amylovorans]MDO5987582.1 heparin lyase I family protein [Flavivirga amylovorans]
MIKKALLMLILCLYISCNSSENEEQEPGAVNPPNEEVVRFKDGFEGVYNPDPSNLAYNVWYQSHRGESTVKPTSEIQARTGEKCLAVNLVANENGLSRSEIGVNLRNSLGDYWYGFSIFIPSEYDISKMVLDRDNFVTVLAQWGVWENNPGLPDFALRLGREDGQNKFFLTYEPSTKLEYLWDAPLIQGEWVDWVIHIKWAKDNTGLIEVWQNKNLVFSKYNFQSTDGDGSEVKSKIGLYYSSWGDRTRGYNEIKVYYDNYTIGKGEDMFDLVDPGK